jgi:maltooligosyltrehalose trehalohydrolase
MIVENALMWLGDLHVDGLRLDAVHALHDRSAIHLLEELATEVEALAAHLNRPLTLIAESDLNDPRLITPREGGGLGLDAQWSDDFHHAVHANLTGEASGYYADFADPAALVQVLNRGFLHEGTWSSFRGRVHGRPLDTDRVPAWRLVVCTQNHDQIGNRARGDRLTETLDEDRLACAALLLMTAPFTPMIFQGEEWAASTPFAFFTSHPEEDLGRATAEGRLEEFARMGWDPDEVPDPQDVQTYLRSVLDWDEAERDAHVRMLTRYRELAALRRERPELTRPSFGRARLEGRVLVLEREQVTVLVNLGAEPADTGMDGTVLWRTREDAVPDDLPGWSGLVLERSGR